MKQSVTRQHQPDFFRGREPTPAIECYEAFGGKSALEDDEFPFESLSDIAELESWRKEINRPIYHIHKWWAQRLGTAFRAITIGALTPSGTNVLDAFYSPTRLLGATVFDPFMGSGTTLGEATKLGARVIGRDINPVAYFLVRNALSIHDREKIEAEFQRIEADVADKIRIFYKSTLPDGQVADVLYFFWVKVAACPICESEVDLFRSRIFARHAYAKRHPESRASCPKCGQINTVRYDAQEARCSECNTSFDPQEGPATGQHAKCPYCSYEFSISKAIREQSGPPNHRLYAKLVLKADGTKEYYRVTDQDHHIFNSAVKELTRRRNPYPVVTIEPGYNTNQAIGYNYNSWHEMFNGRQLLCLSLLAERIKKIKDKTLRDLFTCLFSGALEFNNMFASYKGEGTGAVRHMFAHHILKPERMPLEANPWGTRKSSGSFMTMFQGRIRRALDYAEQPFELTVDPENPKKSGGKIFDLSEPIGYELASTYRQFAGGKRVYVSCGDSGATDIESKSVDAIITDPPFFDNVHYSQLADFFHVWQRHILGDSLRFKSHTTRSKREVQNADVQEFTTRLGVVWSEANRVLKDTGILAFTYHHSRAEGWYSVLEALMQADFGITAVQPIKAEMSVAMPKLQAREPIDLDVIIVCRKRTQLPKHSWNGNLWDAVTPAAAKQVARLRSSGRKLSRNDVRVIVMAQLLRQLSISGSAAEALALLEGSENEIEAAISSIHVSAKK